jgi:hypothetical protein
MLRLTLCLVTSSHAMIRIKNRYLRNLKPAQTQNSDTSTRMHKTEDYYHKHILTVIPVRLNPHNKSYDRSDEGLDNYEEELTNDSRRPAEYTLLSFPLKCIFR